MKYKLAIFDMDGTTLNTLDDLADCMNFALRQAGFPERRLDEIRSFVGNGIPKLVERAMPVDAPAEMTQKVLSDFMSYYDIHYADKTRPYDGVCELILKLRENGCMTAIVSNKADSAVLKLCERYFPDMFDYAVGAREGIRKKPAPDSVNDTLRQLEIEAVDAVYIGDSEVDIQTAPAEIYSIIFEEAL